VRAKKVIATVFLSCLLSLCATAVYADGILPLPHAFYGNVTINGSSAPVGTRVEARGEGVLTGFDGNPITTIERGKYGSADPSDPRLVVQGDILDGTIVTFYVNGHSTGQTAEWHSSETTEINLSVTISGGGGPGGGGPGGDGSQDYIDTDLFGIGDSYLISDDGEILETIEATSEDEELTITIPEGTIALDENGDPLVSLEITVDENPPDPPEGAHIIGLTYEFGPDGATFYPPITLVFTYDPDELPEGVDEEDLVIAYYDENANEWVECSCSCDPETHCITASVTHFSCFSIIAFETPPSPPAMLPAAFTPSSLSISPLEAEIGESVNISVLITNIGEDEGSYTITLKLNGVAEEEKQITMAGSAEETVTFAVARNEAGTYSVDVNGLTGSFTVKEVEGSVPTSPTPASIPPSKVNWAILGPILGVAVFLAIFLPIRLRRRSG